MMRSTKAVNAMGEERTIVLVASDSSPCSCMVCERSRRWSVPAPRGEQSEVVCQKHTCRRTVQCAVPKRASRGRLSAAFCACRWVPTGAGLCVWPLFARRRRRRSWASAEWGRPPDPTLRPRLDRSPSPSPRRLLHSTCDNRRAHTAQHITSSTCHRSARAHASTRGGTRVRRSPGIAVLSRWPRRPRVATVLNARLFVFCV
jgi:hypothetical protein